MWRGKELHTNRKINLCAYSVTSYCDATLKSANFMENAYFFFKLLVEPVYLLPGSKNATVVNIPNISHHLCITLPRERNTVCNVRHFTPYLLP